MKTISIFILSFFIIKNCISQELEGEWKGEFITTNSVFKNVVVSTPIKIKFTLTKDSTYSVFSYTEQQYQFGRKTEICKMFYKKISQDSIYLEEIEFVDPQEINKTGLQQMFLKIIKTNNSIILKGDWKNAPEQGKYYGTIELRKKKKK